MKLLLSTLAALLYLFFFPSCQKDGTTITVDPIDTIVVDTLLDYRDNFTGTYNCHKLCIFALGGFGDVDTTCNAMIQLVVSKDTSSLNNIFIENDRFPTDSTGQFMYYYWPNGYREYRVTFRNDSVFIYNFSGALAGGTWCNIIGTK